MIRFLKIALPVFILGFVAGNAFWYLASPLWIDNEVSEALPAELMLTKAAEGTFTDADSVHKGQGMASVLVSAAGTQLLRLTDFEVTNGPDLEVWLVTEPSPETSADVKASTWVSLGRLKGNKGDQTYVIPEDVTASDYGSVVIWCEQFGVLFSPATLAPTT
ncbi:DM13 domain-containing protein [Algirhabdus cladophorae]|uniref:DM13 domain-containing protein n=1 Tax=Algirhabdus cladophorae TaxID=3377108 RepID=UPI003B84A059